MGFFSFITQNTDESIANVHSSEMTIPVYLIDNKGNRYFESEYQGYGEFGGKDIFELIAEMNGKKTRDEGIKIYYNEETYNTPLLLELTQYMEEEIIELREANTKIQRCENQGFFY